MYVHSSNITQIHHYSKEISNFQLPNLAETKTFSSEPSVLYSIFPDANDYDSAETVKAKSGLDLFI